MELKFKTVFPGWNDEPILQTALKDLRTMYILAGRGRCDFPIRLKLIFLRVLNQWTACWVWLMDALVFYFTSIVFLNAWILMSLDKAFTSRFPTALLAPCYLTSRQIHTHVNCMVSAGIWNYDPQSQDFCLFPHLFCIDQMLSRSQGVIELL